MLSCRRDRGERGSALVLAIGLVLLVSAVAAAVWAASRTETLIASTFRQDREAFYAAEGALGIAIRDLATIPDWSEVLSGARSSSFTDGAAIGTRQLPGGQAVVLCCGTGSLTAEVQQRAHGTRNWATDTPQWQIFAWGPVDAWLAPGRIQSPMYVVVWISDDPGDGDSNPAADSNGIVDLHAQALGPNGFRRIVEATVDRRDDAEEPIAGPSVRVLSWREIRW